MIKKYYSLIKPGIVYGNAIPVIGAFFLAVRTNASGAGAGVSWPLFFATLVGISLVIASAAVFNNFIDTDIDARMERTKDRELVLGTISRRSTIIFACVLGVIGFFLLVTLVNFLTAFVAAIGFFFYVVAYSLWTKRHSIWGTVVGAVSGATPPVVGYVTVTGHFDLAALFLFLILMLWQMPHFYAIAIFRLKEYEAAGIPVLPAKQGIHATKIQMILYIIAFTTVVLAFTAVAHAGPAYFIVALIFCLSWLALDIYGFWAKDDRRWARKMFFLSLLVLVFLFATMAL